MNIAFLLYVLVYIVIAGFVLYLVEKYVPMSPFFRDLFRFICVVIALLLLLNVFGVYDGFGAWGQHYIRR